jgi:hypothetical protein
LMEMGYQVWSSDSLGTGYSGQVLMEMKSTAVDGSRCVKGKWFQKNNYFLYGSYSDCCQWRIWNPMTTLTWRCCRVICRTFFLDEE